AVINTEYIYLLNPLCRYQRFTFFYQAEDGIRDRNVTRVQTCALPICCHSGCASRRAEHGNGWRYGSRRDGRYWLKYPDAVRPLQIGRASCRERVEMSVFGVRSQTR